MTGFCTLITPAFRHGRIIVPLTGGICLLLLVMVLKNILLVPAAELSSQVILYIICYMGFIVSYSVSETRAPGSPVRTVLWIAVCILMTLGIIAVYAI